jgi:hypothetical protein
MSVADVRVAWVEIYGLIASKVFIVQGMAKETGFYSVKKRLQAGKIFQCRTALRRI